MSACRGMALGLVLLGLAFAGPASAEDSDCFPFGYDVLGPGPGDAVLLGRVNDLSPRVRFIKSGFDRKGCPNDGAACQEKAYLVPGDEVVVARRRDNFVCATYIGAKGRVSAGWLPAAAVSLVQETPAMSHGDWIGAWRSGPEQVIDIAWGTRPGSLKVEGHASWGASDPERVARGAVNIGELSGEAKPDGASLSFGMGAAETLPFDEADEGDCKVQMRRAGPYLLVKDNGRCGGMNVTFTGAYRR